MGDRQYKRILCNQSVQDGPQYFYAFTHTGLRLNILRSIASVLDLGARRLLEKQFISTTHEEDVAVLASEVEFRTSSFQRKTDRERGVGYRWRIAPIRNSP